MVLPRILAALLLAAALAPAEAAPKDARRSQLRIMMNGSANTSRTVATGWRTLAVPAGTRNIPATARRNFEEAAELVVDQHAKLPLSFSTAQRLNRLLTRGLVDDKVRGDRDYWGRDAATFYGWLRTGAARELGRKDPVRLAERIHHDISLLDAFPDGNGRTARLMADLALLKAGRAPAYYTRLVDYFERGAIRAPVSRAEKLAYFREIAERGELALSGIKPSK